jgi:hypothetical protein
MNKKWSMTILIFALAAALAGCGGGGSGSSSAPTGVNPGVPSSVQLLPIQIIGQTGSDIFLKTKVLDGNGLALGNIPVTFTNFSFIGMLSSNVAVTDVHGIATVSLRSNIPGFITVESEVDTGASQIRDRKTVFFSELDLTFPSGISQVPTLNLEVDGNNNGIFNEPEDFILFESAGDNQVVVRATVNSAGMAPAVNSSVTFGADSEEATFPLGDTKFTDANGQASTLVQVDPSSIRDFTLPLNITALADNGAGNIITVFLNPVTVSTVTVTANPDTVDSGGSADITAMVTTTAGTPLPDGTTVQFSTSRGGIQPFAQTEDGFATVTFTAPALGEGGFDITATISASVSGKQGSTTVKVIAPPAPPVEPPPPPPALVVTPAGGPMSCGGVAQIFFITGGVPPYTATAPLSTAPVTITNSPVFASGGFFTVTTGACEGLPESTPVSVIVKDSANTLVTITVTVTNP